MYLGRFVEYAYLKADHDRIQIQDGLPVFTQDVQTHVALEVDVGVVDELCALDLGRIVWEVLVDLELELEQSALVHALVRLDVEVEVQDVVGVREGSAHSGG